MGHREQGVMVKTSRRHAQCAARRAPLRKHGHDGPLYNWFRALLSDSDDDNTTGADPGSMEDMK